jgi:hypothetical protein
VGGGIAELAHGSTPIAVVLADVDGFELDELDLGDPDD